jgi:hypothetical protein
MTEEEYWTEYDIIHANRGKTKAEIERILKRAEKKNLTSRRNRV